MTDSKNLLIVFTVRGEKEALTAINTIMNASFIDKDYVVYADEEAKRCLAKYEIMSEYLKEDFKANGKHAAFKNTDRLVLSFSNPVIAFDYIRLDTELKKLSYELFTENDYTNDSMSLSYCQEGLSPKDSYEQIPDEVLHCLLNNVYFCGDMSLISQMLKLQSTYANLYYIRFKDLLEYKDKMYVRLYYLVNSMQEAITLANTLAICDEIPLGLVNIFTYDACVYNYLHEAMLRVELLTHEKDFTEYQEKVRLGLKLSKKYNNDFILYQDVSDTLDYTSLSLVIQRMQPIIYSGTYVLTNHRLYSSKSFSNDRDYLDISTKFLAFAKVPDTADTSYLSVISNKQVQLDPVYSETIKLCHALHVIKDFNENEALLQCVHTCINFDLDNAYLNNILETKLFSYKHKYFFLPSYFQELMAYQEENYIDGEPES